MEHEQSACTLFQLALANDGILKSQVANHLIGIMVVEVGVCLLVLQCHIWLQYFPFGGGLYVTFTHMMLYIHCPQLVG